MYFGLVAQFLCPHIFPAEADVGWSRLCNQNGVALCGILTPQCWKTLSTKRLFHPSCCCAVHHHRIAIALHWSIPTKSAMVRIALLAFQRVVFRFSFLAGIFITRAGLPANCSIRLRNKLHFPVCGENRVRCRCGFLAGCSSARQTEKKEECDEVGGVLSGKETHQNYVRDCVNKMFAFCCNLGVVLPDWKPQFCGLMVKRGTCSV